LTHLTHRLPPGITLGKLGGQWRSSSVVEQGTHKPRNQSAVVFRVGSDRNCAHLWALSARNSRAHNSDRAHT
jgi:hypothetical protein